MVNSGEASDVTTGGHALREVRFQHSREFVPTLDRADVALLASTYQTGKLVAVGRSGGKLSLSFHNFDQALGIAVAENRLAVGTREQVWLLRAAPQIVRQWQAQQDYDACYLTRASRFTGAIQGHEIAWIGEELWIVNTLFSCLASLDDQCSFVPRWRPPFVSTLAADDRCHLNGLAVADGRPKYVTALAQSDAAEGWRARKATDGCIVDVDSGELVATGLAMPHSPRVHGGRLFALESATGRLVVVEPSSGKVETVCTLPGYVRGLACHGSLAFVGLSKIRASSESAGLPIAADRAQLKCGVAVVDLVAARPIAWLEFQTGLDEVFDVQVLPGTRRPAVFGPSAATDGGGPIWLIGEPAAAAPPRAKRAAPAATDGQWGAAAALFNEANRHMDQSDWPAAEQSYRRAIELRPDAAVAHCNLGVALENQERFAEAAAAFERALEYDAAFAEAHFNLSLVRLLLGQFADGWPEYEWRWRCAAFDDRPPLVDRLAPRWDGSPLDERKLLVYGEQGVGDEVMFASCYPDVIERAGHCVLACDPRLIQLYARSFPKARVCSLQALHEQRMVGQLGQFDLQVAAGSLPRAFRATAADFPSAPNYLEADADRTRHWKTTLHSRADVPWVGISWRGGKNADETRRRSISLADWAPILACPGVRFVNLQYGDCRADLSALAQQGAGEILNLAEIDPLTNLDEFAALMSALDLVISIDNSTVHLAGSLGVPTWALVTYPSQSCWRWMLERPDTLWYTSVRLFRRMGATPWPQVVDEVARELQARFASR